MKYLNHQNLHKMLRDAGFVSHRKTSSEKSAAGPRVFHLRCDNYIGFEITVAYGGAWSIPLRKAIATELINALKAKGLRVIEGNRSDNLRLPFQEFESL